MKRTPRHQGRWQRAGRSDPVVVSGISPQNASDTGSYREGSRVKGNKQEKYTHKPSNSNPPDLPTWTGAVADEGDEDGDAGTEHAGCVLRLVIVRDRVDQLLVCDDTSRVAARSGCAVEVLAGLRSYESIVSVSRHEDRKTDTSIHTYVSIYFACQPSLSFIHSLRS
jgi:hypothetical protein